MKTTSTAFIKNFARSYATRAKLTDPRLWTKTLDALNERVRLHDLRQHMPVTNRGPQDEGYNY
ncbi:MAG: hypothetical protein ACREBG_23190 [Pyrinomonadaceae bacterium]